MGGLLNPLVSLGEHRGIALTHGSPLNGLSLYPTRAFELAIASCTPLVAWTVPSPTERHIDDIYILSDKPVDRGFQLAFR